MVGTREGGEVCVHDAWIGEREMRGCWDVISVLWTMGVAAE